MRKHTVRVVFSSLKLFNKVLQNHYYFLLKKEKINWKHQLSQKKLVQETQQSSALEQSAAKEEIKDI